MTEEEYMIEMLCSLPKHLLQNRHIAPMWLKNIDQRYIDQALFHYHDKKYEKMRKREAKYK